MVSTPLLTRWASRPSRPLDAPSERVGALSRVRFSGIESSVRMSWGFASSSERIASRARRRKARLARLCQRTPSEATAPVARCTRDTGRECIQPGTEFRIMFEPGRAAAVLPRAVPPSCRMVCDEWHVNPWWSVFVLGGPCHRATAVPYCGKLCRRDAVTQSRHTRECRSVHRCDGGAVWRDYGVPAQQPQEGVPLRGSESR